MKILAVADTEDRALWDHYRPELLLGVDLILSCGDLHPDYLQFLVTMANCPLLYVRGNHDSSYDWNPPLGCVCVEDRIYDFRGLRILGLGGSMRYRDGDNMYTEEEMRRRIRKLSPELTLKHGFDLLLTHAPAKGYGDLEDLPHRGFDCFNSLLIKWKPPYMLHGHIHREYGHFERERRHSCGTRVINAAERFLLEIGDQEHPAQGRTGSPLYDLYVSLRNKAL